MRQRRFDDHPIERLVKHGFVTPEQRAACSELHAICYSVLHLDHIQNHDAVKLTGIRRYETERLSAARLRARYADWLAALGSDGPMIAEMIEGSVTFTSLARKYGMRWCNARAKLVAALAKWVSLRAAERA